MNMIIRMITMYTTDRVNLGNTMNIYKEHTNMSDMGTDEHEY